MRSELAGRETTVSRHRIRPLTVVAVGLVLVALDFRTGSYDYLPDVAGWLLVAVGAHMAAVGPASTAAVIAAGLSVAELFLPYHLVRFDEATGEFLPLKGPGTEGIAAQQRWDHVSSAQGLVIAAAMMAGAISVTLLVRAMARRASRADAGLGRQLRIFAFVPLLWATPFVLLAGAAVGPEGGYDPVWDGGAELGGLLAVVSLVGLAAAFAFWRDRGWALGPRAEVQSPWEARTGRIS